MTGADPAPHWLTLLVEASSEAYVVFDAAGTIVYANPSAAALLGHEPGAVVGTSAFDFVHPDDLGRAAANIAAVGDGARPRPGLLRIRHADGGYSAMDLTPMGLDLADPPHGPGPVTVVTMRDSTLHDAHWNFLTALTGGEPFDVSVGRLAEGLSAPVDGLLGVAYDEPDGSRRCVGPLPADLAGVVDGRFDPRADTPWAAAAASGEVAVRDVADLPADLRRRAAEVGAADGACVVVPVDDPAGGRPALLVQWPPSVGMAGIMAEALVRRPRQAVVLALEWRHTNRRLQHLAWHDPLTGLANRARFFDDLDARCRAGGAAVWYVDLDGFKPVNDRLGHQAGDEALVACAAALRAAAGGGDLVARLGGDEFAVAAHLEADPAASGGTTRAVPAALDAQAARLVAAVSAPMSVAGRSVRLGASVGAAWAAGTCEPDALVRAADALLYEAKRAGRGTWRSAPVPSA